MVEVILQYESLPSAADFLIHRLNSSIGGSDVQDRQMDETNLRKKPTRQTTIPTACIIRREFSSVSISVLPWICTFSLPVEYRQFAIETRNTERMPITYPVD